MKSATAKALLLSAQRNEFISVYRGKSFLIRAGRALGKSEFLASIGIELEAPVLKGRRFAETFDSTARCPVLIDDLNHVFHSERNRERFLLALDEVEANGRAIIATSRIPLRDLVSLRTLPAEVPPLAAERISEALREFDEFELDPWRTYPDAGIARAGRTWDERLTGALRETFADRFLRKRQRELRRQFVELTGGHPGLVGVLVEYLERETTDDLTSDELRRELVVVVESSIDRLIDRAQGTLERGLTGGAETFPVQREHAARALELLEQLGRAGEIAVARRDAAVALLCETGVCYVDSDRRVLRAPGRIQARLERLLVACGSPSSRSLGSGDDVGPLELALRRRPLEVRGIALQRAPGSGNQGWIWLEGADRRWQFSGRMWAFIELLAANQGKFLTTAQIAKELDSSQANYVRNMVRRIRDRVGRDTDFIASGERGDGYRLVPPVRWIHDADDDERSGT